MINFNDRLFAKNEQEKSQIESKKLGKVVGFYQIRKHGIVFKNTLSEPFAFLDRKSPSHNFLVSCSLVMVKDKAKIRYMFSTTLKDQVFFGVDTMGYIAEINLCNSIKEQIVH